MLNNGQLDFSKEYKEGIKPQIKKYLQGIFLSFIGCIVILYIFSKALSFFELPDRLIFLMFFPCSGYYLYKIFLINQIKCPNCRKSIFSTTTIGKLSIFSSDFSIKRCPHCSANFQHH